MHCLLFLKLFFGLWTLSSEAVCLAGSRYLVNSLALKTSFGFFRLDFSFF